MPQQCQSRAWHVISQNMLCLSVCLIPVLCVHFVSVRDQTSIMEKCLNCADHELATFFHKTLCLPIILSTLGLF
jgi:hypothetical protein